MTELKDNKLNGARGPNAFDKLVRAEVGRIDGLRKLAPGLAKIVDGIDAQLAEILHRLEKIEATDEAHRRLAAPALAPARAPTPDEALAAMRTMTPKSRAAILAKLRQ
jgi:hypothetical protein